MAVMGLVEQLQADALDHTVPVSTLLRKVKVCAAKLSLRDALTWVEAELKGYVCRGDELPEYRVGHGVTMCQDRYGRWIPFAIDNPEWADKISLVHFREQVSNYEDMLNSDGRTFDLPLDNELISILNQAFGIQIIAMRNKIARGHIHGIVESVRNLVLDWSLELARGGISGEGLSFTVNEKERASAAHITIGTFNGSFNTGEASGPGSQINQSHSQVASDIPAIANLIAAVRENVLDESVREPIILAARDIASASDKPSMLAGYERLITAAANHMTIIAPFLPAIGQMLAS